MLANIFSSFRSSNHHGARSSIQPAKPIRARPSDMTDSSQETDDDDERKNTKTVIPAYRLLPYNALQLDSDRELFIIASICRHLQSRIVDEPETYTSFCGKNMPTIAMDTYVARLVRYVNDRVGDKPSAQSTGISIALVAIEYLSNDLQITPRTQHRLFMTAFLVAMKMYAWDDGKEVSNRAFSHVAGCDLRDINWMELFFCTRVRNFTFPLCHDVEQRLAAYTS